MNPKSRAVWVAMIVSLLLAVVLLVGASLASAAEIKVPQDYPTVQAAIDAAQNGDEVVVAPGRYNERIDYWGKAIVVRSTDPDDPAVVEATIIDGSGLKTAPTQIGGAGSVVTFNNREGSGSVLTGLTITGGMVPEGVDSGAEKGGGIFCGWWTAPVITKNIIRGNAAQRGGHWGGGIFCFNYCKATITDNVIRDNWAFEGGGIYCHNYSEPLIENNLIENNETKGLGGGQGGGIFVCFAQPRILNNTIRNNRAGGPLSRGGGIACFTYGNATIRGNRIENNSALAGGGLYVHTFAEPLVENNLFVGNMAPNQTPPGYGEEQTGKGGAVYCYYGEPKLVNDTFWGNRATEGGTIWAGGSAPEIRNCLIAGTTEGGGIFASSEDGMNLSYTCLWDNAGGDFTNVGDVLLAPDMVLGDPLLAAPTSGDFHLRSAAGRWDEAAQTWVQDAQTSPGIDAGDPASDYAEEPEPNGGRINLGRYGNTPEASKSP